MTIIVAQPCQLSWHATQILFCIPPTSDRPQKIQ